jgi:hypothetical protein
MVWTETATQRRKKEKKEVSTGEHGYGHMDGDQMKKEKKGEQHPRFPAGPPR